MVLEYNKRPRLVKAKTTLRVQTEQTIRSLIITLGVMIIVLASASFLVANTSSQKGHSLQQMKLENEALKDINQDLHVEIVNTTAGSELENEALQEGKIEPENKDFVTREDNLVE